mgnify:CR=1 FL=1
MRYILLLVVLLFGCKEPKIYECAGWDKRLCTCPNGEIGRQKCSRGPAFADPPPVRTWLPCDCCYDIKKDDHGVYYINKESHQNTFSWCLHQGPLLQNFV